MTTRRSFLLGLGSSIIAAPAIVRASSLMKIKPLPIETPDFVMQFARVGMFTVEAEVGLFDNFRLGEIAKLSGVTGRVIREEFQASADRVRRVVTVRGAQFCPAEAFTMVDYSTMEFSQRQFFEDLEALKP